MSDVDMTLSGLREHVAAFVDEREWAQFHNAKDLAAAIAIEAAELMELFLWKSSAEVKEVVANANTRQQVMYELADVVILCLSMANRLEIDVADAVLEKMELNGAKYPADQVRGRSDKYTHYAARREDSGAVP